MTVQIKKLLVIFIQMLRLQYHSMICKTVIRTLKLTVEKSTYSSSISQLTFKTRKTNFLILLFFKKEKNTHTQNVEVDIDLKITQD